MTTTTLDTVTTTLDSTASPTIPPTRDRGGSGVTTRGVLRSEWLKLRSVRSTITTLAAAAGSMLLVGLIFSGILGGVLSGEGGDPGSEFASDPTGASLAGTLLAQLIVGVLGVLVITSEYATGLIRTTLTSVPKRLQVLWSKATVLSLATFPVMLVTALVAFLAGQALIGSGAMATASLGDPGVWRAILDTAGYLTGVALIGLAVGTLLRSTSAAISVVLGAFFLLPGLASLLIPTTWEGVLKYLPSNAGTAITSMNQSPDLLGPGAGLAVFLAWIVVPLALAAVTLKRRSA